MTLLAALIVAGGGCLFYFVSFAGWRVFSYPWVLLSLIGQVMIPSVALALWLATDSTPTWRKALLVLGTVLLGHSIAIGAWISGFDSALDQAYASLAFGPVIGGAICAAIGYAQSRAWVKE